MYDPECRRCPLSEGPRLAGKHVCVPGEGPVPCDILFYGEAPGENEETHGRPFVGQAGHIIDEILELAGLSRSRVHISNVARCRPPGNRNPSKAELAACTLYTVRELEAIQPKVIVTLGGVALEALTGKTKVGESRGKLLPLLPTYRSDVHVVPSYHPASMLHQPHLKTVRREQIVSDIQLALKVVSGGAFGAKMAIEVTTAPRALKYLEPCSHLICDCEWEVPAGRKSAWPWSREQGRAPRLISIALAGRVDGQILSVAVPAYDPDAMRAAEALIQVTPTTYHNAPADLLWLLVRGLRPILKGDTMLLGALLNVPSSLGLKVLAPLLTHIPPGWDIDATLLGVMPQTQTEWDDVLEYNAKDTVATLVLEEAELVMAQERDFMPLYERVLLPAIYYLSIATLAGVPMDEPLLREMASAAGSKLQVLKTQIIETVGSTKLEDAAYAVERLADIQLPRTPKTHKPSIKGDVLSMHKGKHQLVDDLLDVAKLKKLEGTYLRPWKELLEEQGDSRLHSIYRLAFARTGRSSAEAERGGTMQQFPRGAIRRLVRARPGWKLVSADESQIELRVAAWKANERRMIQFFHEGVDIHRATPAWIKASAQGVTLSQWLETKEEWMAEVTDEERQGGKASNFGFIYGMREETFIQQSAKDYGMIFTMEQATVARSGYFELYPDLVAWHDAAWKWVRLGYVEMDAGRRRMLSGEDESALHRKAINSPVQGLASDLSLAGMVKACLQFEQMNWLGSVVIPLGFIHDAVLLEVRESVAVAAGIILRAALENPDLERIGVHLTVPLKADLKIADTWAG